MVSIVDFNSPTIYLQTDTAVGLLLGTASMLSQSQRLLRVPEQGYQSSSCWPPPRPTTHCLSEKQSCGTISDKQTG